MRAYGIEEDKAPADNFADAGNTYYTGHLAAVKRLGISNGVGGGRFAPEQASTRQEMFTLLYNALRVIRRLPQGDTGRKLSHFDDAEHIDAWAREAVAYLVKTGAISGNAGMLYPTNTATRAEMAQLLYNLLSTKSTARI